MEDEDYRALIAVIADEMRTSGAADLANERHYATADPESGEARLLAPQRRLVEMLEAFDRFLAIQDRETYDRALSSIAKSVAGDSPRGATVELIVDDAIREVDLSASPDLASVRESIRRFIVRLVDGDLRPGQRTR